jgi:hypothetical protein
MTIHSSATATTGTRAGIVRSFGWIINLILANATAFVIEIDVLKKHSKRNRKKKMSETQVMDRKQLFSRKYQLTAAHIK